MRRFITYAMAIVLTGSVAVFAQKVTTPEGLDKAMKRIPPAQGAMGKAIQSMNYTDAKKQLEIIEDSLEDAHNFWVVSKKPEAVKLSQDSMAKADALDKAMSVASPD